MRRVWVVLYTPALLCALLSFFVAQPPLLAQDPLPPCGIEHYDLTDPDWLAGNPGGAYLGNTNTAPDPCPPDIFLICNGIDTAAGHNGPDISSPPVSMWCGVPTFPPNKPGVNAGAACIGGDTRTVTLSTAGGDSFQISGSPGLGVVNGTSATFTGLQEGVGYQFQGIASNSSGNSGWSDPTPPVYHDLSAPVTTADLAGQGDGQMYRSEVSVALLANDTGCLGVVGTTYTLDGVTSPYSGVFSVRGEGTHTLSFASTDGVHSEAPQTLTLFIDVTPPRTTLTQNGNTLRANATDNLSGVSVTMYRLNGGEMQGWFAPLTLSGGNHTVEFASVDFAGNAEAWQTAYYSIPYGGGNFGSQGVDAPVTGGAPVRGYPDWSMWDEGVPTFPTTPRIPHLDGRRGGGDMNPPVRYTPAVMPYVEGRRGGGSMNPPVRYVPAVEPERRGVGRGQTVWADNAPMGVPSVVASIPSGMDDRLSKAIAALSLAATVGAGAFSILEQKRTEQLERAKANRAQNTAQHINAQQQVSVAATISNAEREYNRIKAERAALREQWLQAEAERLKAEEERRLKEEAARYAAYLAALRREQNARRANAARVRGARMEADMMAAEEAELSNAQREAELRQDRNSEIALAQNRMRLQQEAIEAARTRREQEAFIADAHRRMAAQEQALENFRTREAAERAAIAAENTRQSREARAEQTAAAQEAAWQSQSVDCAAPTDPTWVQRGEETVSAISNWEQFLLESELYQAAANSMIGMTQRSLRDDYGIPMIALSRLNAGEVIALHLLGTAHGLYQFGQTALNGLYITGYAVENKDEIWEHTLENPEHYTSEGNLVVGGQALVTMLPRFIDVVDLGLTVDQAIAENRPLNGWDWLAITSPLPGLAIATDQIDEAADAIRAADNSLEMASDVIRTNNVDEATAQAFVVTSRYDFGNRIDLRMPGWPYPYFVRATTNPPPAVRFLNYLNSVQNPGTTLPAFTNESQLFEWAEELGVLTEVQTLKSACNAFCLAEVLRLSDNRPFLTGEQYFNFLNNTRGLDLTGINRSSSGLSQGTISLILEQYGVPTNSIGELNPSALWNYVSNNEGNIIHTQLNYPGANGTLAGHGTLILGTTDYQFSTVTQPTSSFEQSYLLYDSNLGDVIIVPRLPYETFISTAQSGNMYNLQIPLPALREYLGSVFEIGGSR